MAKEQVQDACNPKQQGEKKGKEKEKKRKKKAHQHYLIKKLFIDSNIKTLVMEHQLHFFGDKLTKCC